ncbi:MAG TPA: response regulator [Candidatus Udaeobacter sp.]|nr:response regulator [Candidatus Udaeobacter sp.]
MNAAVSYVQDAGAAAFVLLGMVTAVSWLRRRDASRGYLALAIILLAAVSGLGRVQALVGFTIPLLAQLDLVGFAASAYALLLYRDALIPLSRRWRVSALVALTAASGLLIAAEAVSASKGLQTAIAVAFIVVWCGCVGEPIVRFWLVARALPSVQAWRLRSVSLGFGGLVAVLLFAISGGLLVRQPAVQIGIELIVVAIVPLLYASFSPPAWLRREWRSSEEEGLRRFMEELLITADREALATRALDWAMRLVGGASAVLFDSQLAPTASRRLTQTQVAGLVPHVSSMRRGVNEVEIEGSRRTVLMLPITGLTDSGTLIVLAGPFTPDFGDDEMNRVQQFASAFVNALDRIDLIARLEQSNAALQEANRHKSVFLANMSHELRTPLNAIIGFSELLTDAPDGQFDQRTRKRFLEQILTSGRHLLGLINDILDLSKVEAGQMELRLHAVSIRETVEQVVRTVEPLVTKKGIRLEADVSGAGDVLADEGKLKQMLLNLVSNAIKFTPEGGDVTIATHRTDAVVEISVADTGIGIADEDQKQIFKEFHQVDHGPGRRHEGTGLGLALTKRFALLHGGDVRVQSRVDKGSVFTLVLPVRSQSTTVPQPAAVPHGSNGNGSGPLILVAEDDPAAAELLTRQLVAAGYRVVVARTGSQALAKARELRPAAITLDIILPELDGWEVITRLKSEESTSSIPIVVVSIVDNPELGIALGAVDYFVKPVDATQLVRRLNQLASQINRKPERIRVLIVDDEAANRTWLTAALEPAGFTVVAASGGREAIEMARLSPPDLVVLDLMMPEVTGFDVVEALRSDVSTRETPIMVLTAANLTEADKRLLNGRVSQVLSRGSLGSSDIVGLLKRVVVKRSAAV